MGGWGSVWVVVAGSLGVLWVLWVLVVAMRVLGFVGRFLGIVDDDDGHR